MKKFLLATVGLVTLFGIAAPASAADMAVKAPPPPPPPIYSWTGFYIGGNGGWGQSHNCVDFVDVAGLFISDGCRSRSGGLAGGQIGYRWQTNQFVVGVEAQGDWADLSNQRVSLINPDFSTRTKTDAIGLFTGQLGWAWNQTLFYVKGGAAVTRNRLSILDTFTGFEFASASATRWGGTVGVDSSMASLRVGLSVSNTTTCLWATQTIRSRSRTPSLPVRSIGSARTWIWSPCA